MPGGWIQGLPLAGAAPDGSLLAVLRGETVILLDPASGEEVVSEELTGAGGALTRVVFSADSRTLAVGSQSPGGSTSSTPRRWSASRPTGGSPRES